MLIAQNWLTGLLRSMDPAQGDWSVTPEELDAGFVRVGFETEGYAGIEETRGALVLGRVTDIEELTEFKKPIRYCQVDVGQANGTGEPQGIICGARNFVEGDLVVVALPGTELPGGFKISARETYGRISNGMICSAAELGLTDKQNPGIITVNLGTGRGYSVLELHAAFEKASGKKIPYKIVDRRPGDIAACYADPAKAYEVLGWKAEKTVEEMCADSWRWQSQNPNGYTE